LSFKTISSLFRFKPYLTAPSSILAFKIGGTGTDCLKKDFESGNALPIRRICDKLLQLVQLVTHVDVKRGE
jgi:hypothetical protein